MHQFCSRCGTPAKDQAGNLCGQCGASLLGCPDVLTLLGVFANDKLLLIKRGQEPYQGKWAVPGGYVEPYESAEAAAARELREETGLVVDPKVLFNSGIISLTFLNQIHLIYIAEVEEAALHPAFPEVLDAKWFSCEDYPRGQVWGPFAKLKPETLFRPTTSRRIALLSQTDDVVRRVETNLELASPWGNAETFASRSR